MNRWLGGFWLVGAFAVLLFGACAPITSDVGTLDESGGQGGDGGSTNRPVAGSMNQPDPVECTPGESRPAGDGCNTCSCDEEGRWLCTEIGCNACLPGESRPAGDGCNTCSCDEEGRWLCTEIGCSCEDGATRPAGDGCNTCQCREGSWDCTLLLLPCPTPACTPGQTQFDGCTSCVCRDLEDGPTWTCNLNECQCSPGEERRDPDSCNTCYCIDGTWLCTDIGCDACVAGETRPAADGCNTCTCNGDYGLWECTDRACPEPPCEMGLANCDGVAANGCETNIATSVMNCGACGNFCSMLGASSACKAGLCVLDECDAGFGDCNGDPDDGCEAPVGPGGCEQRCEAPAGAPDPSESRGDCNCPEGTACVIGSVENEDGEYCFPLPEACDGDASCGCLGACVCPENPDSVCREEMSIGGMIVHCSSDL